jgi:hypothetical protein
MVGALHHAGYRDERWYPIGLDWSHGFALTTRLERIADDGSPTSDRERWSSFYAEPANLRWLDTARNMRLLPPGRYRVLLLAFTDLPVGTTDRAPLWNEQTFMAGPNAPTRPFPSEHHASRNFRPAAYIYEYVSRSSEAGAVFLARDDEIPPAQHIEKSGLSILGDPRPAP